MLDTLTQTEENYLKAIYKANERSNQPVNTNTIAKLLNTSAASVTDMLKKLAQKELIIYEKYKGARLSPSGSKTATSVIRKHRLWETFLVQTLGFSWEEVHEIAEELEHIKSNKLVTKLDEFLGHPKYDPHGDPIPSADGKFTLREQKILTQLDEGQIGILVGVKNHDKTFLDHLNDNKISLGSSLYVVKKSKFDNSLKILLENESEILLSEKVSSKLLVKQNSL